MQNLPASTSRDLADLIDLLEFCVTKVLVHVPNGMGMGRSLLTLQKHVPMGQVHRLHMWVCMQFTNLTYLASVRWEVFKVVKD
jgi:hypothetical protein